MAQHEQLTAAERQSITALVTNFVKDNGISASELARRANTVQPFIWSVLNGRFIKMTPRLKQLIQYIRIIEDSPKEASAEVQRAIDAFIAIGGDPAVLTSSIEILTKAFEDGRAA